MTASPIGAIMRKPAQAPVSAWTHYFRVADIDAAKAAVEAGGGKIMIGADGGAGRRLDHPGHGPAGAHFSRSVGAKPS